MERKRRKPRQRLPRALATALAMGGRSSLEVAAAIGCAPSSVGRWAKLEAEPSLGWADELAEALGLRLEVLDPFNFEPCGHMPVCAWADSQPNLGLASTRELLEELRARGEAGVVSAGPHDRDDAFDLASTAGLLLSRLPSALLDYRTVEGT